MYHISFTSCEPTPVDRHNAAWELLYNALSEHFHISREMASFAKNENGKPYLTSHENVHFSLSHTQNLAVCALSDAPIGIDCEKLRPISARIKSSVLSLREDEDDREALRRWTKLESYAKLCGKSVFGMTYEKDIEKTAEKICRFDEVSHTLGEDHIVTVCYYKA